MRNEKGFNQNSSIGGRSYSPIATKTESGISNIAGLTMVGYELNKMGLFYK